MRSLSARTTVAFLTVDPVVAHVAGHARALEDLAGVVPPPIEPGARCESEPCVSGPRRKWWRLTVPAKPLPLDTPVTSTSSPAAKRLDVQGLADLEARDVVDAELARVAHARQVLELAERGAW